MHERQRCFAVAAMMVILAPAWAEEATAPAHTMENMNHDTMPGMHHDAMSDMDELSMEDMNMDHQAMPATVPPSDLRDPHAYADGYDFSQFPMRHEGGEIKYGMLRVDRLEAVRAEDKSMTSYELQAGYGGDFDRALFKSEGEVDDGKIDEASTELFWSHAVAVFWNMQLGLRYDSGEESNRSWLALGIQGLAPYWFEVAATAYVGKEGHTALNLEAEYELLLTQKWILQPRLEADFYGKNDVERGAGSGLSELAAGLRLRYEIRRQFAPYVGVEWVGKFGGTADYARNTGHETKEERALAGVRFWF